MPKPDRRIDEHWPTFGELRADYRKRKIILGIDRQYARQWLFLGGPHSPILGRLSALLLGVLTLLSIGGAAFSFTEGAILLGVFLLVLAFLSWRLLLQLAVAYARQAALADEALFRQWFRERRLSVLIRESGDIIWNDSDESSAANGSE